MLLRIIHNLKSKSRKGFGIHSPFVYQFQREILNSKAWDCVLLSSNQRREKRILKVLIRMIKYFGLNKLLILSDVYQRQFNRHGLVYDNNPKENRKYDLLVLGATDFINESFVAKKSFVVLLGNQMEMKQNLFSQKCDVFLNLYSFGICVFREGLSHEEFKLKF